MDGQPVEDCLRQYQIWEKDGMEIRIEKLTADRTEDYLYFFEHVAFTDHEEWAYCYCLESHLSRRENEDSWGDKECRSKKARQLIAEGVMEGYLVYDDGNVVGWCNAGDKTGYRPIMKNRDYETMNVGKGEIKSVYCFEIAPGYRGKGIAHLLLDRIVEDAREEGYSYVEGYPFTDRQFEYQYHGPIPLYEKHGFQMIAEKEEFCIMQRKL